VLGFAWHRVGLTREQSRNASGVDPEEHGSVGGLVVHGTNRLTTVSITDMTRLCTVIALFVSTGLPALSQEALQPIEIGERRIFHSDVLNEDRTLLISPPKGYANGAERYAVLYLLDGGVNFDHVAGLTRFLATNRRMPPVIIVALPNTNRTRDLTPPSERDDPTLPGGGGADYFLQFLSDEIIPWVDAQYRTRPVRLIAGHSLGGLFALHTIIQKPGLFRGVITASASLQWNDQALVSRFSNFLEHEGQANKIGIYMTTADEGLGLLGGNLKLAGLLAEKSRPAIRWRYDRMPAETHGTVSHPTIHRGLEFIFEGWSVDDSLTAFDDGGLAGLEEKYAQVRREFGYEPKMPVRAFHDLCAQLIRAGRLEAAMKLFVHDPEAYPVPAFFWAFLAAQFEKRGDDANALHCWGRTLELDPNHQGAKERLASP
jgi:predicted alpha/beta superfamily hydrolase